MQVLYEDKDTLGVFKPAGMPSQDDPSGDPSLLSKAQAYLNGKAWLVHRLDRPIPGVMLFAKTERGARELSLQFQNKLVRKVYWARVTGVAPESETLIHYLENHPRNRVGAFKEKQKQRKRAELSFKRISTQAESSLIEIYPATGRKHQIRAQLAAIRHPIVGDRKYGARLRFPHGIALIAKSIEFKSDGKPITVTCQNDHLTPFVSDSTDTR